MTDYSELVEALRERARREDEYYEHGGDVINDAAAAIEALDRLLDQNTQRCEELRKQLREAHKSYEKHLNELEAQLPKRGEWIDGDGRRVTARCSVCGHLRLGNGAEYASKYVHFCENCGSKMGGQNDEP